MARLNPKPVARATNGVAPLPQRSRPRFDMTVVQSLHPDDRQDPRADLGPELPKDPNSHFVTLLPSPLGALASSVRYAMDWASPSRSSPETPGPKDVSVITSQTAVPAVFKCLLQHGCPDVSSELSPFTTSPPDPWAGGSYGEVYKWTKKDGSAISIKCLRIYANSTSKLKHTKRASRELYNWSKARHNNVLELNGIALFNGQLAMVSPWMTNGSLRKYIESYSDVDRWGLCIQVAEGLAHIHSVNMVHGDLKAENVLVSDQGIAKIGDFGNSILEECSLRHTATTNVGGGTTRWMAWELLDHEGPPVDRSAMTDVYSLGMTILEVVTGEDPYAEYDNVFRVMAASLQKRFPRRPGEFLPHQWRGDERWRLLLSCWNLNPSLRPDSQTVLEAMEVLH